MKQDTPRIKRQHLHDIRTHNRSRILQILRESDPISRQELAERLDLTSASLSRISRELIAQGICVEAPILREISQRGRPSVALKINARGGYLVAISLSSFSCLITVIDLSGQRHHQQEIPKCVIDSASATVAFIGNYVDDLVTSQLLQRNLIIGAALTLPGSINLQTGFLTKSVFLNWPNFSIKDRLAERLGCPIRVENNGDALCRHFLDSSVINDRLQSSVFLAHVSAGMGASIAIGGRIVRRLADEGWINDIIVPTTQADERDRTKLSQVASGWAILARQKNVNTQILQGGANFSQMLQPAVAVSNQRADSTTDAFYDAGRVLGASLVPLTIAIAPDTIVLAGPVLKAQAYSQGVEAGYGAAVAEMDIQPARLVVSHASYIDASECLALHDFFLSGAYGV